MSAAKAAVVASSAAAKADESFVNLLPVMENSLVDTLAPDCPTLWLAADAA
jgi:hypothetical protein